MFAPRGWLARRVQRQMYRLFQESELFDPHSYKLQLRGLAKFRDPIWHYIMSGWKTQLVPSRFFDPFYYEEKYDDVRAAKLNPLFHYLAYGKGERRARLRSAREVVTHYLPESAELRAFTTPSLGQQRITVMLDSLSRKTLGSDLYNFVRMAAEIAQARGASLRILYRNLELDLDRISESLDGFELTSVNMLEITEVPCAMVYSDIPFFGNEISIATSWSSAEALRYAGTSDSLWLLCPPTVKAKKLALAKGILPMPGFELVSNTVAVRQSRRNLEVPTPGTVDMAAGNDLRVAMEQDPQWKLGVLATPDSSPGSYALAIDGLNEWLVQYPHLSSPVNITALGEVPQPMLFLGEIQLDFLEKQGRNEQGNGFHALVVVATEAQQFIADMCSRGFDVLCASDQQSEAATTEFPNGAISIVTSTTVAGISSALKTLHARHHKLNQGPV